MSFSNNHVSPKKSPLLSPLLRWEVNKKGFFFGIFIVFNKLIANNFAVRKNIPILVHEIVKQDCKYGILFYQ